VDVHCLSFKLTARSSFASSGNRMGGRAVDAYPTVHHCPKQSRRISRVVPWHVPVCVNNPRKERRKVQGG